MHFTRMVDCIQAEGGILDKFIGDAIMAIFGTPFSHEDDGDRAVCAAIAIQNRDFSRAKVFFTEALKANTNDKPSQIYIDRCVHYLEAPPPEGWSGEWVMTSK